MQLNNNYLITSLLRVTVSVCTGKKINSLFHAVEVQYRLTSIQDAS